MSDDDNPYLPPKAPVADAEPAESRGRPISVWIAVSFIALLVLQDSMTWFRATASMLADGALNFAVVMNGILLLAEVASAFGIARGRNWARFLFLLFVVLELALLLAMLSAVHRMARDRFTDIFELGYLTSMVTPHVLSIAALVLVFGPGRSWFRKRG